MTKVVCLTQTCKPNMELTVDFISASFFVHKSATFSLCHYFENWWQSVSSLISCLEFDLKCCFNFQLLLSFGPMGGISSSDCCGIKESANINIFHSQTSLNWPLHMLLQSENIHDESGNFCFLSFFFFIWAVSSDPLSCVLCYAQRAPGRLLGGGALRVTPACSVAPPSVW